MNSLKWGIIGPGNIAHDFARDLALIKPTQKIVALLTNNEEHARGFAKEFEVDKIFTEPQEFVSNAAVDIAYIATPHPQHFDQALLCLNAGIHVLCEKPMTINSAQSRALIDASEKKKCFLMEGMWIRFLPSIEKVLELIKAGTIGRPLSVKASMGYKAPKDDNSRYFNPELGGGSLLDLGIYTVFLAQLLLGKPEQLKAIASLTDKKIDQSCAFLFGYKNGGQALLDSSLVTQSDRPAEIAGEKGLIRILNPWFEKSVGIECQLYDGSKEVYPCEWEGHGLQYEVLEVLRCLENGAIESQLFSHQFSREISESLDEIRRQTGVEYPSFE